MKKTVRVLLLVLVLSFIAPLPVEAKKPAKPKRVEHFEDLFEFKLPPLIIDMESADLDKLLNPDFDSDKAWEIREEQHEDDEDKIEELEEAYEDYKILTLEEAKEDLDYLIDLMRIASLDYNRVGGDEAFKSFRKKVVKDLKEIAATRVIYAIDLERAIARWMHFIDNEHFWVGSNYNSPHENRIRYIERYGYPTEWRWVRYSAHFMCENLTFQKEGEDYRCYQNNKKVDLEHLVEHNIDIVPAWTNDFKVIYRLHYYGRTARKRPEAICFKGGHKETPIWTFSQQVPLDMAARGYAHDKVYKINGVAYVNLTDDVFQEYDPYDRVETYREMGEKLAKYRCVIFDLRNNTGGYSMYIEALIHRYLGYKGEGMLKTSAHYVEQSDDAEYYMPWEPGRNVNIMSYSSDLLITHGRDKMFDKYGLAVVLVNNQAGSCGDESIDLLRHLENSVIIGDATSGILVSSGGDAYFLPNSGMFISIPWDNRIWHPDYFEEGRGFYPDIWMMTDNIDLDALTRYMREITPARSKK